MAITVPQDASKQLLASIKRYFAEHLEQDIGDLKASMLLDYVLKEIGPTIYNQAIVDAQAYFLRSVCAMKGASDVWGRPVAMGPSRHRAFVAIHGHGLIMTVRKACRSAVAPLLGVLIACASNRAPVYVAPTNQTIEVGTEMTESGDAENVYVINHSSAAIMVTALNLYQCENIKNRCEVQRLRVRVRPGQRENLATVRPLYSTRAFSFRFTYAWEPARDQ
jgi:uncharacterized protein (DUF2164 family)